MPIQMVCDSTPSLVSAAIRDALHSTGSGGGSGSTNGRAYGATGGGSSGVTVNGSSSSAQIANKQQQQQAFRRTTATLLDDQLDEPEEDAANDLVESISQSLRQGQQVKPITYEEGPSYSASLDKLKAKYIVLKATVPPNESATSSSTSNNTSATPFGGLSAKLSNASSLTMNGGAAGAMKLFSSTSSNSTPSNTGSKSSGANALQQQQSQQIKLQFRYLCQLVLRFLVPLWSSLRTTARRKTIRRWQRANSIALSQIVEDGVPASASSTTAAGRMDSNSATLPTPKRTLFPRENVQIGWKTTGRKWLVGAGMMNMGNTCYLNSTLQALFHVPAIANWLLSDEPHRAKCDDGGSVGSCIICAMAKTLLESQSNQSAFRPYLVYSKLRLVCKHLVPGRQEDAHEFLRYLVEAMEKSYLARSKNSKELDQYSKETTPLNQILGGYLRSEVKCLSCQHVSTTFQHFEDLLLDIRKASSIDEALEHYFARERLEEMGYKCEACKRRVAATKQFSLERAPFVLCVQLKRFSVLGGKINKNVELRSKLDLTPFSSPAMRTTGGKLMYRLTSMVTHLGNTQHCGHYTAIGHTDAGGYHVFDDSTVRPIGIHSVMSTNAYILFYELESVAAGAVGLANGACRAKATVTIGQPSSTATLTSMGHLSNGSAPTGGTNSGGGGGSSGGGGGGSGGTPGKATHSPSPLRVLGTGNGNGAAGGLVPSKLEQKCGFIGPVLPPTAVPTQPTTTAATSTTKQTSAGGHAHTAQINASSSALSCAAVPDHFSSPSSTASTLSNASPLCSPVKHHQPVPKAPKLPATATTAGAAATNGAKSLSMPRLGSGSNGSVVSLVPYDSDDTSGTTSSDDDEVTTVTKSIVLTNGGGKRVKTQHTPFTNGKRTAKHEREEDDEEEDDDDVEEDEEEDADDDEEEEPTEIAPTPRSPQIIKTKAGLWKVSQSSTADQLSQPESGSSSASSSKSCSPATSGGSSPMNSPAPPKAPHLTNGHQRHHTANGGKSSNNKHAAGTNGISLSSASPISNNSGEANAGGASAVQQLLKYSHRGYGAPVKSWNGQQTTMERELAHDRREERKRQFEDDRETEMDRGRVKKTKSGAASATALSTNGSGGSSNLFQQYQNHQSQGAGGGKWMGGNGANRTNFHNNHHHHQSNGYRGGNGYYQNGNGNRHQGSGGFRNGGGGGGGRRFGGGRNGGGFHTKAHHHHQRGESGSGMAGGGGGGSNGFYHR
uniref:Ubiquitin carboxyl-terminal hydrolase 36 n=1 Tax=Anopheles dirus TaxID=7168 RepID=A0A182NHS2_9DIPT